MRTRTSFIAAASLALALAARAASAEDLQVFTMADGRVYHPASGTVADSMERLHRLLGTAATPAVNSAGEPVPAQVGPVAQVPTSFETAFAFETPVPPSGLRQAVLRGREMLKAALAADAANGKKPRVVNGYDVWVDVTLAVWNERTDEIKLVSVRKNGMKMTVETEGVEVPIRVKRTNGVNSEFVMDDGGERHVVAVRYPIFKDVSTSKRNPRYELKDVVYTPYSSQIHDAETVAWGVETLRANIAKAYDAYRAAGIRSRAFPDRLLADVIDPKLVEQIAVIEHLGETALFGEDARRAFESVYVVIGANQDDAYDYSRSSAGARGLVQFIPGTYALMARRPELGLIKDFEAGMADPVNAIKAQIAYLDAELASMPLAVKDLYFVDNARVGEYLAAAYNAGGSRIRRAIARWGDAWSEPHDAEIAAAAKRYGSRSAQANTLKNATLKRETVIYVKKLRAARALMGTAPVIVTGA